MSRGLAILLLAVYICSRIYLHDPPGSENNLHQHPLAPLELKREELHLATADPEVNQWVCLVMLALTIGIMATTAEWVSAASAIYQSKWSTLYVIACG